MRRYISRTDDYQPERLKPPRPEELELLEDRLRLPEDLEPELPEDRLRFPEDPELDLLRLRID